LIICLLMEECYAVGGGLLLCFAETIAYPPPNFCYTPPPSIPTREIASLICFWSSFPTTAFLKLFFFKFYKEAFPLPPSAPPPRLSCKRYVAIVPLLIPHLTFRLFIPFKLCFGPSLELFLPRLPPFHTPLSLSPNLSE